MTREEYDNIINELNLMSEMIERLEDKIDELNDKIEKGKGE